MASPDFREAQTVNRMVIHELEAKLFREVEKEVRALVKKEKPKVAKLVAEEFEKRFKQIVRDKIDTMVIEFEY